MIAATLLIAATAPSCSFGTCSRCVAVRRRVVRQNVAVAKVVPVVATPVIATPVAQQVFYSVGSQYRQREEIKTAVREVLQELQSRQPQQHTAAPQQQAYAPGAPLPSPSQTRSLVKAVCGQCHSGVTPKGDFSLDGIVPITCESVTAAIQRVRMGDPTSQLHDAARAMPPSAQMTGEITADQRRQLIDELLLLQERRQAPAPPQGLGNAAGNPY